MISCLIILLTWILNWCVLSGKRSNLLSFLKKVGMNHKLLKCSWTSKATWSSSSSSPATWWRAHRDTTQTPSLRLQPSATLPPPLASSTRWAKWCWWGRWRRRWWQQRWWTWSSPCKGGFNSTTRLQKTTCAKIIMTHQRKYKNKKWWKQNKVIVHHQRTFIPGSCNGYDFSSRWASTLRLPKSWN